MFGSTVRMNQINLKKIRRGRGQLSKNLLAPWPIGIDQEQQDGIEMKTTKNEKHCYEQTRWTSEG